MTIEIQELRSLLLEIDKISKSQAGQDLFVLAMTQLKKKGTYLEIGCGHPKDHNNTWLLEKFFDWTGYAVDRQNSYHHRYHSVKKNHWPEQPTPFDDLDAGIQLEIIEENFGLTQDLYMTSNWQTRPNSVYIESDAFAVDYESLPGFFDYLQVDLDDPTDSFNILERLVTTKRFSVITFEHDVFIGSIEAQNCQSKSRDLLGKQGYVMVANNLTVQPGKGFSVNNVPIIFEDWWVDPAIIPGGIMEAFSHIDDGSAPKYYTKVLFGL